MKAWLSFVLAVVLPGAGVLAQDQNQNRAAKSEPDAGVKAQAGVTAQVARIATYKAALGELDQEMLSEPDVRPSLKRALLASALDWLPVSQFTSSRRREDQYLPTPARNPFASFGSPQYNTFGLSLPRPNFPQPWNSSQWTEPSNPYQAASKIREWELRTAPGLGGSYAERVAPSRRDIITSAVGGVVLSYYTDTALSSTSRGLRAYGVGSMMTGTALQAGATFGQTVNYVGKSMQVMNPPIYLQDKIAGWGWKGAGFNTNSGRYYWETLKTAGPGPITRTHADLVITRTGTYYRHQEIKTPATKAFERRVLNQSPVNSYWDPKTSTVTTTTTIHYRSGAGSWNRPIYGSWPSTLGGTSYNSPLPTVHMPQRYADMLRSGGYWQTPSTPSVPPMPKPPPLPKW